MKCLDTTFLIDVVEHPEEAKALAEEMEGRQEPMATTVFNAYEALVGVYSLRQDRTRGTLLDLYARLFARLVVLPMSLDDGAKAAEIGGSLRRRGHDVGVDALTAAIALRGGCDAVVTRNVAHFRRIETLTGLAVVSY